jgi:hypothetical protein
MQRREIVVVVRIHRSAAQAADMRNTFASEVGRQIFAQAEGVAHIFVTFNKNFPFGSTRT